MYGAVEGALALQAADSTALVTDSHAVLPLLEPS